MLVKLIIVGLLLAIVASLLTSMRFLIRDESSRRRTLTALKLRVGLSITLVLFVLLSWYLGWIEPHAVMPMPAPTPAP